MSAPNYIPDEKLVAELQRFAEENGRPPKKGDDLNFSKVTFHNHFGSWNDALRKAGFEVNEKRGITDSDVICDLRDAAQECEGELTYSRFKDLDGYVSATTAQRRFGSWNEAKNAAGLGVCINQNCEVVDEELLADLKRLDERFNEVTANILEDYGKHSIDTYKRHFGSWNSALEKADIELNQASPGTRRYDRSLYSSDWDHDVAPSIRERDKYECRICGKSSEKQQQEIGKSLDVHHIKPLRHFGNSREEINHEKANDPSNLITLCRDCHSRFDGKWVEYDVEEFSLFGSLKLELEQ